MNSEQYEIRDPIHGFIRYSKFERDLINSLPFQRLRFIRQLALTHLLYPGAEHTRFTHSLGVMEFATKIFDSLEKKQEDVFKEAFSWNKEDFIKYRQLLRLVALLHDLGHGPFSHASESETLFPREMKHEDFSAKIILNSEIRDIIDSSSEMKNLGIKAQGVANIISEKNGKPLNRSETLVKHIFSSDYDADKMDYLLRDSYYCGVEYGKYDHARLVSQFCLVKPKEKDDWVLGIDEGGVHALEALTLAKYFMFTQVYFHEVRRAYNLHLLKFLEEIYKKYPIDVKEYLKLDDLHVIKSLRDNEEKNDNAYRIINRKHFREAYRTSEHAGDDELKRFEKLKSELEKKFEGITIYFDGAEKKIHNFASNDFCVRQTYGGPPKLLNTVSKIVPEMPKINTLRVFTSKENKEEIKKECEKFMSTYN